jgi:hypothetical protein|tara:strand:+ start:49 stop:303 length:255 start_codon:yes stop_codon:yes gene_type:complete
MAIKQTKVSEENLKEIEEFQKSVNLITYQFGQIALQRLSLQKQEKTLELQHEQLLIQEKQLGDKLKEKYGNSQIDLKTGEIIAS